MCVCFKAGFPLDFSLSFLERDADGVELSVGLEHRQSDQPLRSNWGFLAIISKICLISIDRVVRKPIEKQCAVGVPPRQVAAVA